MKVYINSFNAWLQGLSEDSELTLWAKGELNLPKEFIWPKPQYYPKAQLRRLSPFSKVALHCLDIPQALTDNLPLVFASQHGDLAKTVELIKNTAIDEDLSPTQFALSVHNATTGLFSIATKNTAPTTTISAGNNTFIEGLIEASMQCLQEETPVLYTFCEFDVPSEYRQFQESFPAHCLTMIISPEQQVHNGTSLDIELNSTEKTETSIDNRQLSIDFIKSLHLQRNEVLANSQYTISLGIH
jgi:hypothetical protein